jgi:site-specific DNA-methyltransferase (adenine-specific)
VIELKRILKPAGSLYLFCSPQLNARIELLVAKHFEVLNSIVWAKPSGRFLGCRKESLRAYFPQTERIVFAQQYTSEVAVNSAKRTLKAPVFAPLIDYFANARKASGISAKEINEATGTQMCRHWFSASQWQLPSKAHYEKLQALFQRKALCQDNCELKRSYNQLTRSYDELKREYDRLRRPFNVTKHVPFTDVWTYEVVQPRPDKHECEKPTSMMRDIINASSLEGQIVCDVFMGSGVTGEQALAAGRRFIGIERDKATFEQASRRITTSLPS